MMPEASEISTANGGNASRSLPRARTFPVFLEPASAAHALSISTLVELCQQEIYASRRGEPSTDGYGLELSRRAIIHGDVDARAGLQRCLSKIVLVWLRCHPSRETACCWEREEHYVELAFERFWHIVIQRQVRCETLAEVLVCLRASLNGAILETLRVSRQRAVYEHEPAEQDLQGNPQGLEAWNWVQATLSSERERRLAYLLYHCGLKPAEIVRDCPQEWSDVHEVARLRHIILASLSQCRKNLR